MKKSSFLAFGVVSVILGAAPVSAHHSAAPFNFAGAVELEGTVKELHIENPHAAIILEVTDEDRGTRNITFEGMSASIFYRSGYYNGAVEEGDSLRITAAPRHDGEDGGFIISFVNKDGEVFGFGL